MGPQVSVLRRFYYSFCQYKLPHVSVNGPSCNLASCHLPASFLALVVQGCPCFPGPAGSGKGLEVVQWRLPFHKAGPWDVLGALQALVAFGLHWFLNGMRPEERSAVPLGYGCQLVHRRAGSAGSILKTTAAWPPVVGLGRCDGELCWGACSICLVQDTLAVAGPVHMLSHSSSASDVRKCVAGRSPHRPVPQGGVMAEAGADQLCWASGIL